MSLSLHIKEHSILGIKSNDGELTTVTAPLVLTGYDISIPVATSSANGYLSSTDWTTFNGKQSALVNSAGLLAALDDETGTGLAVFNNSPTLITPVLGTPTSGTLTNCTGLPVSTGISGLGANVATFLATPSSANLISAVTDETGTGSLVFATTPTLVTPEIGVATGTSLDLGGTTLLASRQITVDTGGVFNISIGSASGDDFTVDTDKFVVEGDTGNVGIGTTEPGAKLDVQTSATGYTFLGNFEGTGDPGNGATRLQVKNPVASFLLQVYGSTAPGVLANAGSIVALNPSQKLLIGIEGAYPIQFYTSNRYTTPDVTISSTGNVGIGTTGPEVSLDVVSGNTSLNAFYVRSAAESNNPIFSIYDNDDKGIVSVRDANVQKIRLDVSGDSYLNGGNVGIGTAAPGAKLDVNGVMRATRGIFGSGSQSDPSIELGNDGAGIYQPIANAIGFAVGDVEKVRITSTGNVGIGTVAPDRKVEINTGAATGGIRLTYNDADGSATTYGEMLVDSNGDLAITATGGDISLGDENLSTTGSITGNSYIVADGGTIGSASDTDVMTIDASGNTTFTVFPITPSAAPDADYEVANKKYVDDNAGGASTALDNLASVQINTTLVSDADSTDDLGTTGAYWANLYADAVHYDKIGTKILSVGTGKDYTTITLAEAAVADDSGYTIEIHPGMYTETVTCSQNNIHFKAIGGPDQVTVTQANNEVFIFGAHTGCTVEGLTISVTAATTTLQNPIEGSGGGTIKNCVISWVSSTADIHGKGIEGIGGEWNIHDNIISATNTSANSDVREIWGMRVEGANNIATIYNNRITVNNSTVGAGHTYGIGMVDNTATTLIATNNHITITSAATTTGRSRGIWSIATNGYILGNKIKCTNSSTGTSAAVAINSAGATTNITGNVIYSAVTTDGDGQWLDCSAGTVNASNNTITGDAGIGTGGTLNLGGNAINGVLQSTDGSAASTGAGTIKMASANPANSAGFLKFTKNDGTVVYVPYFTDETP